VDELDMLDHGSLRDLDEFMRKITADELTVVPWKNGGGVTTEIAVGPPRSGDQEWSWRVSIADVPATGPFSVFPGIDRSIAVIEGEGMDLRFEAGRMIPLELNRPVDFDGGASVDGILRDDPIRDFNVMADRRYFRATLDIVLGAADESRFIAAGSVLLTHVLDGRCTIAAADIGAEDVRTNETVVCNEKADWLVSVSRDARVAVVVLEDISCA
jgi:environmental stress-induced protein Ves